MFTGFKICTLPTEHFLHFFYDKLTNPIELKVPSELLNFHFLLKREIIMYESLKGFRK